MEAGKKPERINPLKQLILAGGALLLKAAGMAPEIESNEELSDREARRMIGPHLTRDTEH